VVNLGPPIALIISVIPIALRSIHLGKTVHAVPAEEQKAVEHRPASLMQSQGASVSAASTSGTSDIELKENGASLQEAVQPANPANVMGGETKPASFHPEPEAGRHPSEDTSLLGGESSWTSPKDLSQAERSCSIPCLLVERPAASSAKKKKKGRR
jgi:hypothetical protein